MRALAVLPLGTCCLVKRFRREERRAHRVADADLDDTGRGLQGDFDVDAAAQRAGHPDLGGVDRIDQRRAIQSQDAWFLGVVPGMRAHPDLVFPTSDAGTLTVAMVPGARYAPVGRRAGRSSCITACLKSLR